MFTPEVLTALENAFKERLSMVHSIDPTNAKAVGAKKAMSYQLEFFAGAMTALSQIDKESATPPKWIIALMSGRSIV